jgi:hypothetical protein
MSATSVAPPQVQPPVEKKTMRDHEPESAGSKRPAKNLLVEIFEGHEEFLGWTPD